MGHGLQGSGPLVFWFGVSCAKGSATAQPPEIPAFHVSPRCLYPLVYQSTSTFSAIFTTTTITPTTRRTYCYPGYLCLIFWTSTRQRVGLFPDYQIIHPIPLICIFSADATDKIFGRDTAANPATVHLDSLSVPRPCQFPPIQTHGRLRADSIRGQGPGFWSA